VAPPFIGPVVPKHRITVVARSAGGSAVVAATGSAPAARPVAPSVRRPAPAHNGDIGVLPGTDVLPTVNTLVTTSVRHPTAPIALAAIVVLFLLVQHRIDRRDPKLRRATSADLPDLEFGKAVRYA
jgi:hypothetical protein